MPATDQVTFVVAFNDREVLDANFLASPCVRKPHRHSILLQENFASAAKAYNDAIEKSPNDLMIFCHQDIFFPDTWLSELQRGLDYLEQHDQRWGVLGCSGITVDEQMWGQVYSSGLGVIGKMPENPMPVQTLDEIVLIFRKSSGLRFDDDLPHFHLYGTDVCMRATQRGMTNYAVSAFCVHNTHQLLVLPKEFYVCCAHVKKTWEDRLPIQTTCIRLTPFNLPVIRRRLHDVYLRYVRGKIGATRVKDVQHVVREPLRGR